MLLHFRIHYRTQPGQQLLLRSTQVRQDDLALLNEGDGWWTGMMSLDKLPRHFSYQYLLVQSDGRQVLVQDLGRQLPKAGTKTLFIQDYWRAPNSPDRPLHSSAFEKVIFKPVKRSKGHAQQVDHTSQQEVLLHLNQVHLPKGLLLGVLGNIPELGNWQTDQVRLMDHRKYPEQRLSFGLPPGTQVEYKYVLVDAKSGELVRWESGDNRHLATTQADSTLIVNDYPFRMDHHWKGSGVALPVFALRTQKSCGIGEFADIPALVDWARQVGLDMIQILPINDTSSTFTWVDSYPYSAISVFALHPIYLNLAELEVAPAKKSYEKHCQTLNALLEIDYEAVLTYKLAEAKKAYKKAGEETLASSDFQRFLKKNAHWLRPYAVFCYFRDQYGTAAFQSWPDGDAVYSAARVDAILDPAAKSYTEAAFHLYLQFHLDQQLRAAADYARTQGIVLKGDIPIGIDRESADAWTAPHLYNMDGQAGAPPDDFATAGQNWGFPTYNWSAMAQDDYQWWKDRFTQLSSYFDAFRIDHILGFFRIWEIPYTQVEGIMGRFRPALAIQPEEFTQIGIAFDDTRYCQPYITAAYIRQLFGVDADWVFEYCLTKQGQQWSLREAYATQRSIQTHLPSDQQHLQKRLFSVVSNVLFFKTAAGYHPRIDLHKTTSFQELDEYSQQQIMVLYHDYFYSRQEDFWRSQGMTKLPAIKAATDMLICGEDLGMVPACVPDVMRDLGILTLEIQRMAKNPQTEFLAAADIPYWSVCSPSTHDMAPLRLWWEEMPADQRKRFYHQALGAWGSTPSSCTSALAEAVLRRHLHWRAMWVIFPLQDFLAIDEQLRHPDPAAERINVPAIAQHYWRYRMHLSIEALMQANHFNSRLRQMLQEAGRGNQQH